MKSYINVCFVFLFFMNNISYGQNYECDNNFNDCGSPNQSGGGGKGTILINNTDLGDSYQNADDYDDDGIEDSSDNCMRYPNFEQYDRDGDGVGDMCDNCLYDFNYNQKDSDGDGIGDLCDEDIDGDKIINIEDPCVFSWGNNCKPLEDLSYDENLKSYSDTIELNFYKEKEYNNKDIKNISCDQKNNIENMIWILLVFLISISFIGNNR